MQAGEWWHNIDHNEPCRVADTDMLWGQATRLVWLPRRRTAVPVLQKRLAPLKSSESHLLDRLSYVSAAARIADFLAIERLGLPKVRVTAFGYWKTKSRYGPKSLLFRKPRSLISPPSSWFG